MADANKGNAAKEFFEKFGEKLALIIALVILVGYGVIAFAVGDDETQLKEVEKNKSAIDREQKTPHKEMTAPDTENWQAKAVNPWTTLVASARGADDWGGSIITKADGKGLKKEIIKKVPVKIPHVAFGNADVAIDQISLNWLYKDFTPQEIQKMVRDKEKSDAAKASYFVLERETNGSGKWEVLAEKLETKVQTYVDSKIEPKTKYAYRVTAYSTDKAFLERGGAIDPETGATSNPDGKINTAMGPQVSTMGIWKLSFTSPSKGAEAAKGMVYVKIEKFEKGLGKVEKAHIHYDGDQIGWWEETAGADPTSKHRVATKGGKAVEIDFDTKATLVSVAPVKIQVDVKRCKAIYAGGAKTGCEQIVEKRNFDTNLITYKDDEGLKKIYVPSPNVLDQLCDEHGGRKIVTSLPASGTGDKKEDEAPKVDPKEVARMKREADAEKLFEQAEAALEKNKSLAMTSYQRLLKEFADTDVVSKSKKATIEERIALLKSKAK